MKTGLRHEDAGKYIPKTTFTDVETEKHYLSIRYEDWSESSKTIRHIKKYLKEEMAEQPPLKEEQKNERPEYHEWTNTEGKIITAQFVGLSGENITLKMRSGKQVNYPLQKLNNQSQEQAKSLGSSRD